MPMIVRLIVLVAFVAISISTLGDSSLTERNAAVRTTTTHLPAIVWIPPTTTSSSAPPSTTSVAGGTGVAVLYTYSVRLRNSPASDVAQFRVAVQRILEDPRGWSMGGTIRFRPVDEGGDFTVWLSAAPSVRDFSPSCEVQWSCRVGRDVVINAERWQGGSPLLEMELDSYRHMVLNHEVGHWLGLDHEGCPTAGGPAAVMQQQSKGLLLGCTPNSWPLPAEQAQVLKRLTT